MSPQTELYDGTLFTPNKRLSLAHLTQVSSINLCTSGNQASNA